MKAIKNINVKFLIVTLMLMVSSITYAQPPGGGQQGGQGGQQGPPPIPNAKQIEKMVSELADDLSLSETQEASVLELYQSHFEEIEEKTSGNNRPERSEMEALKSEFEKEVKALLDSEQKEEYVAYLKEQESSRQRR